ncbi:uncharacterized protein LOC124532427 [Vanessa cardui]|uniref:uncharacterized protein LOC124532427 n=1 Tax=Vanessa cardui TaxID=171605 RepID=UPI001F143A92|nr:uncharacterized protein LOC124532427 [Vanessa cardui]
MTRDEKICEEFFEKTTKRDEEVRYIVRLPFNEEDPQCFKGETKEIALRRFKLLERKLIKNPDLYDDYKKVIEDYIIQHHMIKVSDSEMNSRVFYLPHHAVIREDKETTKVRCVFDASCKGSNNVSLNSCFIIGPKLQQDLRHILMRWRLHPYCVVADIVQMYRQIRVHGDDSDCLRILWRFDPNKPIETYKHVRLPFGTSCAPYLAVKCLQQLAKDEKSKYPIAAKITLQDFYMDDLLTGGDDENEIIEIYDQMNKLMKAGGFCLQKWCTNSENLLNHIKADKIRSNQAVIFKENNMIKVLGICWNKNTDNFEYLHHVPEADMPITKRNVLSDIARLYDPLGWIAPVIITAKIYMQKLWKSGLAWDDNLTPDLLKEWLAFRCDLVNVKSIIIPRWLQVKRGYYVELHAFADASQAAYAAAVYMKSKDVKGNIRVHLITAKTRVAPVEKEISIPRLELCAALLAAQLIFEVSQVLNIPKERLRAWSDSTTVLAWITGEPSRWTTFVSNRVSEILTILNRDQWNHVNSKENPADCASRGIQAENLKDLNLWWFGPSWLKEINEYETYKSSDFITNEEQRSIKNMSAVVQIKDEEFLWTKFSNLQRLLRVLSYCRRVLLWKIPNKIRFLPENITPEERNIVLQICIKDTQNFHFKDDINMLKNNGYVSKSSKLHTLCPILDVNGVLRVGGRIEHSQASFDTKHSIILPEAVSNLSTEGFIAAFRRFVSRRGYCKDLYSDNGTNFVGADKELREMFNKAVSDFSKEIKTLLANEGTTWHYIPPQAPNFGGLWEACVRSTKYHLKRVIGDTTLTYEELSTLLTQIEACLNSRPLCPLSDSDVLPLTPGHFLIGEPLITIPDEDYSKVNITGLQRWKLVQKMLNDFWKRWSAEYLITLNQRYKWSSKGAEPEIGDIVIIRDENLPPAKWLLGKVEKKHTGKDNITRVVTVKTKSGLFKRACNKLCFLPMSESVSDN